MLTFKQLTLQAYREVMPFLEHMNDNMCDFTPGSLFMWRSFFDARYCVFDGALYIRSRYPGGLDTYAMPITLDESEAALRKAMSVLREYIRSQQEKDVVFGCVAREKATLLGDYFSVSNIVEERRWFDYVYEADKLQTFSGKKLHGQRNHLNRFNKTYPNAYCEYINDTNIEACLAFTREYEAEQTDWPGAARAELEMTREVLTHYDEYGMVGLCLRDGDDNDCVLALATGSIVKNMLFEHIEKALRRAPGAYAKICSEFARAYAAPAVDGVVEVNREDDMGDLSLRDAKLSLHPSRLIEKYTVYAKVDEGVG